MRSLGRDIGAATEETTDQLKASLMCCPTMAEIII